jgi:glycosyltransferase involved in cell wall biosynthesis
VDSVLKTGLDSFSIVIIDDGDVDKFLQNRRFLQSLSVPFKHFSSIQARKLVQKVLEKIKLPKEERDFIENCVGLASPFNGYIEKLLKIKNQSDLSSGLKFAPYSSVRNLGIYCAVKFFDSEIIIFLDDDCLLLYPKKLITHLKLIGTKLNQKTIVAVSGLYKDILVLEREKEKTSRKILKILRGMDSFLKKAFKVKDNVRFEVMPSHMLGGTLILSWESFSSIPFDPYVARGEDHAYALDLKSFLGQRNVAVRDSHFIVGHLKEEKQRKEEDVNVLRDIFRFVYMRAKTGCSFVSLFTLRWFYASIIKLITDPSRYTQCFNELKALLFLAPKFAKKNRDKFRSNAIAWKNLLQSC